MKKLFFIAITLFTLGMLSCKKESNPLNLDCSTVQDTTKGGYLPVSAGNFWKYVSKATPDDGIFDLQTIMDSTKTFNGKIYHAVLYQSGSDGHIDAELTDTSEFYSLSMGNVYSLLGDEEDLFLKNDAVLNDTWSRTNPEGDFKYTTKVIGLNDTRVVNGVTYRKVMTLETKENADYDTDGIFETLVSTEIHYVAKGVGIIEWIVKDETGAIEHEAILSCFNIK